MTPMMIPVLAAVIAFVVTAVLGKPVIHWLRKMKFGQKILEIGPKWHMNKQNIPTMGGFMFMIGIAVSVLVMGAYLFFGQGSVSGDTAVQGAITRFGWLPGHGAVYFSVLLIALAYGLVGMIDDWAKIKKKQNAGLTPMQKLAAANRGSGGLPVPAAFDRRTDRQRVDSGRECDHFAAVGGLSHFGDRGCGRLRQRGQPDRRHRWPRGQRDRSGGDFLHRSRLPAGQRGRDRVCSALAGGLLGFLIFNFHPAKVFMGDTGSLFLGGAVAGLAFACDMPLILIPVGLIYIVETLSVMLQVTYFKATHGKRLFKMAPIHHHFEMCGWSERKIVGIFTLITIVMCILAWMLVQGVL